MLPRFNIGDTAYTIINNDEEEGSRLRITAYVAMGEIDAIIKLDENNYQYRLTGKTFSVSRFDTGVYGSIEELIQDFKEVIIK